MIELIAAAVSGAVVGGWAVWMGGRTESALDQKLITEQRNLIHALRTTNVRLVERFAALRSNCFIHNEKGHFTPYSQASVERRVKAETPKEVV